MIKLEEYDAETEDEEGARGSPKRQKLDLPTLTEGEKRVVLIQYKKNNPFIANEEAVLEEYLKFMYIKIHQEGECTPPKKIDDMWHAHILSTREYFAFCERCNRKGDEENAGGGGCSYIHHNPTVTNGRVLYETTLEKYEEHFGHKPTDRVIWPNVVDRQQRSDGGGTGVGSGGARVSSEDDRQQGSDGGSTGVGSDGVRASSSDRQQEGDEEGSEGDDDEYLDYHTGWYTYDDTIKLSMLQQEDGESLEDFEIRWHLEYALRYEENPNQIIPQCSHDWAKEQFDDKCTDCVTSSMDIKHEDDPELESPFGRGFTCG